MKVKHLLIIIVTLLALSVFAYIYISMGMPSLSLIMRPPLKQPSTVLEHVMTFTWLLLIFTFIALIATFLICALFDYYHFKSVMGRP